MPKKQNKKKSDDKSALFIPAGLFIGMGFGFFYDALVEGLFIGLGIGFLLFAIVHTVTKNKN